MTIIKDSLYKLKTLDFLFIISNVIFIALYIIVAVNNRISHDDFYSIYIVENFGIIEGAKLIYNNWCTRYVALIISFSTTAMLKYNGSLIIYQTLLLALAIFSIFTLLKSLTKNTLKLTYFHLLNYSVFLSAAIFYCSFNISETWFWLSSNCTYLLSTIITIGGLGFYMTKLKKPLTLAILSFCGFLIGGTNGTLSLFLLIVISFGLITSYLKIKRFEISKTYLHSILVFYLTLHLAFLLMYVGKGNEIRSSYFNSISVIETILMNFKFCGIIIVKLISKILPYCILFSIPFIITIKNNRQPISLKTFFLKMSFSIIILFISIYIFQLPITYKTQDIGAERTLYPLAILTFIFCCYNIYQIGLILKNNEKIKNVISHFAVISVIALNTFQLIKQKNISSEYSKAFDQRLMQINNEAGNDLIILKPLPKSGYIHSAEISTSSKHFTHEQLKKGLKINGELQLNTKE